LARGWSPPRQPRQLNAACPAQLGGARAGLSGWGSAHVSAAQDHVCHLVSQGEPDVRGLDEDPVGEDPLMVGVRPTDGESHPRNRSGDLQRGAQG
jgi:hypothetical protein